jgi:hypothetical protein
MTVQRAKEMIYWALVSYCEDSIGSDKREQKQIDKAWKLITDELEKIHPTKTK